jgi:hypothetical protein
MVTKEEDDFAREEIAEDLGHSRKSITSQYIGGVSKKRCKAQDDLGKGEYRHSRSKDVINECVRRIKHGDLV